MTIFILISLNMCLRTKKLDEMFFEFLKYVSVQFK